MNKTAVSLIGAPTDIGAGTTGSRMGPDALRVAGIAGSTLLGSGEVALILDVPQLVQRAIAHEGRDTGGAPRARFLAA